MGDISIAIVTATKNAAEHLPSLISSLADQSDKDFHWVVCDGGSSDSSIRIVENSIILRKTIINRIDFGIYDALNFAVKSTNADYYLVVGADDQLDPDAIKNYRKLAAEFRPDFVAATVTMDGRIVRPRKGFGWLLGMPGEASSHSVGLLIRTGLHNTFGMYSARFPIAADQLFVLSCLNNDAKIVRSCFRAGNFGTGGASGSDDLGMIVELFRVQVIVGRNLAFQISILIARLLKAYLLRIFFK